MPEYLSRYQCPSCGHGWHEIWDCACDSDCPKCGTRHISPVSAERLDDKEE